MDGELQIFREVATEICARNDTSCGGKSRREGGRRSEMVCLVKEREPSPSVCVVSLGGRGDEGSRDERRGGGGTMRWRVFSGMSSESKHNLSIYGGSGGDRNTLRESRGREGKRRPPQEANSIPRSHRQRSIAWRR
jgi:hypothetical protein